MHTKAVEYLGLMCPLSLTDGTLGEIDASDGSPPGADESALRPQATH